MNLAIDVNAVLSTDFAYAVPKRHVGWPLSRDGSVRKMRKMRFSCWRRILGRAAYLVQGARIPARRSCAAGLGGRTKGIEGESKPRTPCRSASIDVVDEKMSTDVRPREPKEDCAYRALSVTTLSHLYREEKEACQSCISDSEVTRFAARLTTPAWGKSWFVKPAEKRGMLWRSTTDQGRTVA